MMANGIAGASGVVGMPFGMVGALFTAAGALLGAADRLVEGVPNLGVS